MHKMIKMINNGNNAPIFRKINKDKKKRLKRNKNSQPMMNYNKNKAITRL